MPSSSAATKPSVPNDLEAIWMPFTANRSFKAAPRLVVRAEGMHYYTADGRALIDGSAGLWCTNAGHNRRPIVDAIKQQAEQMDFAPPFQFGHPKAFELASRIAALTSAFTRLLLPCLNSPTTHTTVLGRRSRAAAAAVRWARSVRPSRVSHLPSSPTMTSTVGAFGAAAAAGGDAGGAFVISRDRPTPDRLPLR